MAYIELSGEEQLKQIADLIGQRNARFFSMLQKGFQRAGQYFIAKIQEEQMTGRPGLKARTGNLRRSWWPLTYQNGDDLVSKVFTDVKYARIHQTGGDINIPARERTLHFKKTKRGTRFSSESSATPSTAGKIHKNYFTRVVQGKAHVIHIPKRLRVLEDFQESGLKMYAGAIVESFKEFQK
jgi:phage gpG-like protein